MRRQYNFFPFPFLLVTVGFSLCGLYIIRVVCIWRFFHFWGYTYNEPLSTVQYSTSSRTVTENKRFGGGHILEKSFLQLLLSGDTSSAPSLLVIFSKTDIYNFIPRVVGAFLSYYYPCVLSVGKFVFVFVGAEYGIFRRWKYGCCSSKTQLCYTCHDIQVKN